MSDLLPIGAYVRFREYSHGFAATEERTRVGRVVGYDIGHSKYHLGARYPGWGKWLFAKNGTWVFPNTVEEITEEEALS